MSELDDGLKKRIRDWVWQQGFEHTASPGFPYAARRFAVELHTRYTIRMAAISEFCEHSEIIQPALLGQGNCVALCR